MVLAHGTNRSFLHIIIINIIVHIIHIFLSQPASSNMIAYFTLKPMDVRMLFTLLVSSFMF